MNQDDLKKLLEEALKPLKEGQDELKKELTEVKDTQVGHTQKLDNVITDLQEVRDTQEEQVLPSVVTIETEIKAYADMYKINNSNAKKLEKRVEVLEDKSGVTPPPELTLANVA